MSLEIRWLDRFDRVTDAQWEGLRSGDRNPFLSAAFLRNLEAQGCIRADLGWQANHLSVWQDGQLLAMAPGYRKHNSHGEFVFDHAWAHAYAQYGQGYYPKQLFAVPYSPVSGARWYALDAVAEQALLSAMRTPSTGISSVHVNFPLQAQDELLRQLGWLARIDVQYHWSRRPHWDCFADVVADMDHKHRKNIRRDRRQATDTGLAFRIVHGEQISAKDMQAMYGFYLQTFAEYGNYPALTLEFFEALRQEIPESLMIAFAETATEAVAGAFFMQSDTTLYGRYWGALEQRPGLHFEVCYYRGMEFALEQGLQHFEPGAQGVHKIDRGFLPHRVHSCHWIADPQFRAAISDWCRQANRAVEREFEALNRASPFKEPP